MRDISWGTDCDACGDRMNAERAAIAVEQAAGGDVLCGGCRTEAKLMGERDALYDLLTELGCRIAADLKLERFRRRAAHEIAHAPVGSHV